MLTTVNATACLLSGWITVAVVRILLGSSTSPAAYLLYGLLLLIAAVLLVVAIRQLITSGRSERKIELAFVIIALASIYVQGLFGDGETLGVAVVLLLVSACVLGYIYVRRLRRSRTMFASLADHFGRRLRR